MPVSLIAKVPSLQKNREESKMRNLNWCEVLDQLKKLLENDLLKLNRRDLSVFCVENEITRKTAEDFLKNFEKSNDKRTALAEQKKEEGNEKYKKKEYQESLVLYTKSIFYANKGDECLPLAYSNRSMAFQKLDCPFESIFDIDMALANGYPKDKLEKLMVRKARCLVQLGNVEKARDILREALKNSKKDSQPMIKNELERIKNLKNEISKAKYKLPKVLGGENENFICASKHVSVYYDETKGRHVKATQDIQVGDVLFVEKPFAFIVLDDACHNCCETFKASVPCWNCLDVSYCSPECRDDFWKSTHSFECGFADLFKSIGIAHLSLRIVLNASFKLDELRNKLENISEPVYKTGIVPYRSRGYDSVYNLVHHTDEYEINELFYYVMTSLLLALYLKNHTSYFPKAPGDENLKFLTRIISLHILQLICNGHAKNSFFSTESKDKSIVLLKKTRGSTSIYPSASMMNHSCEPSIFTTIYENHLIVRSAKVIKKGEEVFNCYGPDARRMSRVERQNILRQQYFFECKCKACSQDVDIQDVFTAFKCSSCKGASIRKEENSQSTALICLNCGEGSEVSVELLNKYCKFYSLFDEGERLREDDVTIALKKFLNSWLVGREIFYKFHKDLSYAADEVAKCLATLKDYKRCILFLKCSVRSVEKRFGSDSIELANEMKKLSDVIMHYVMNGEPTDKRDLALEGVLYCERSHKIMSLLYDSQFNLLHQIEANKILLQAFIKSK